VFIELRECLRCHLYYRFPTDTEVDNRTFYQADYKQGFTTDMPSEEALARLRSTKFAGHEKSYAHLIELLKRLGVTPGARIYDYGCSWGFGSWQFMEAGYEVRAFEISGPRAEYARSRLSVECDEDIVDVAKRTDLRRTFDVFFSNHVMEHVPRPHDAISLAQALVKPGGLFVSVTPNGSLVYRAAAPSAWHKSWGKVHPNLLSDVFWRSAFGTHTDHLIRSLAGCSSDVEAWTRSGGQVVEQLIGPELLCVARFP